MSAMPPAPPDCDPLHHGTPSAASLAALVHAWFPDEALRRRICVDNPSRLYGFSDKEIAT